MFNKKSLGFLEIDQDFVASAKGQGIWPLRNR